jgi:gamma-glutamyltranspeptidase/glutathione hydrolase
LLVTVALAIFAAVASPALAQLAPVPAAPEDDSGFAVKNLAVAPREMVVAANPMAVDAGLEILAAGGSATDAVIAVQMALNVVEPQSSGLGGGGFLLVYDAGRKTVASYDGRETAPAAATPELFLDVNGKPLRFRDAVFSGLSVGTPGIVRMLALAHARHGRLPWARLFAAAIKLAEEGFELPHRLSVLLAGEDSARFSGPARALLFDPTDRPLTEGRRTTNLALASTLRALAADGPEAFYKGRIADAIATAVSVAPERPGNLSREDLANYVARERTPVCVMYRSNRVCGMGPPSAGGIAIAMVLKLIEPFDLGRAPLNPQALHLIAEAERLAWADRDLYIADPDQVAIPKGLLDPGYLAERRRLIDPKRAMTAALPGSPPGAPARRSGLDPTQRNTGTSHISIIDRDGHAAALTTSIESQFGSRQLAAGFLLNNQLTDFSFLPTDAEGRPIANAVAPGKRPRSTMAPTIVLDPQGRPLAVLGSPGGSRIAMYVVKTIVGIIDWGLDAQAAADLANFGSRNGPIELEKDMTPALLSLKMQVLGQQVTQSVMTSGLHIVLRRPDGMLEGGADPRRDGVARGR